MRVLAGARRALVALPHAQTGGLQARHQLARTDWLRAERHEFGEAFLGVVVVVVIETARRNAGALGERVQFIQRMVTDEVPPQAPVRRPHRRVDENRNDVQSVGCQGCATPWPLV